MKRDSMRRCIACRSSSPKDSLLRFVLQDNEVVLDEQQRKPGRGAYIHPRQSCWAKMVEAKLWNRAFRRSEGPLDRNALVRLTEQVRSFVPGAEPVGNVTRTGKIRL